MKIYMVSLLHRATINEAKDDGVAVSSAGPYANHVHLAPDTIMPAPHHSFFCRPDALPDAQPTVLKKRIPPNHQR